MPSRRKTSARPPAIPAESPKALRFLGHADHFVSGVAQSDLEVIADPVRSDQVTPEQALELLQTGLYAEKKEG